MVTSWECFSLHIYTEKTFLLLLLYDLKKIINGGINSFAISFSHLICLGDLPCQYIQNCLIWAATWCDRLPLR